MGFGPLLSNGRQRVGAFYQKKLACPESAFNIIVFTVECGNRLRVGVLVLKTHQRVGVCMSALLRIIGVLLHLSRDRGGGVFRLGH